MYIPVHACMLKYAVTYICMFSLTKIHETTFTQRHIIYVHPHTHIYVRDRELYCPLWFKFRLTLENFPEKIALGLAGELCGCHDILAASDD